MVQINYLIDLTVSNLSLRFLTGCCLDIYSTLCQQVSILLILSLFSFFPGNLLFSLKQISCPCSSPLILCIYLKNIFIDLFNLDVAGLSCSMWGLVPRPGIEPRPPALEAQTLRCWTTREGPSCSLLLHPPSDFAASLLSPDTKTEASPLDPSLPGPSCPLPFSSHFPANRERSTICVLCF